MKRSIKDRVYAEVRRMALDFQFLPGERLNETVLSKRMGVSRTPLRWALTRLVSEGLLTFSSKGGFSFRAPGGREVFELCEYRLFLEQAAVRLVIERATNEHVENLFAFDKCASDCVAATWDAAVSRDEQFHEALVELSGNTQMLEALRGINARTRFVRWFDISSHTAKGPHGHDKIIAALRARNVQGAEQSLREHIRHRIDEVMEMVERGYGRLLLHKAQHKTLQSNYTGASLAGRLPAKEALRLCHQQ